MKVMDLENLFPERLGRAAMEYFGMEALGAVLLQQLPAGEPRLGSAPDIESLDRDLAELLHRREIAQARSYRLLKRRNEFLAGRVSAKLALAQFWAAKGFHRVLPAMEIINDSTGRPFVGIEPVPGVEEKTRPTPEISISHGGAYGAALAADAPCGIDLQEQKDTLLRVLDKYCSAEEGLILAASLPEMTPLVRLSLLWTAKEAAKKACSSWWMPGFLDLQLDLPVQRKDGWQVLSLAVARMPEHCPIANRLDVLATAFNQYGLAVCVLNEARRHAGTAGS